MKSRISILILLTLSIVNSFSAAPSPLVSNPFYAGGSNLDFLFQSGTERLFSYTSHSTNPPTIQLGNYNGGSETLWITNYPCDYGIEGLFVNSSNNIFCFGYENILKKSGVAIHQISPFATKVFKVIKTYSCPNCLPTGIQSTSEGVAIIPTGTTTYSVFNSALQKISCSFDTSSSGLLSSVFTSVGNSVYIGGFSQDNTQYILQSWSCSENSLSVLQTISLSQYQASIISHELNIYNASTLVTSVLFLSSGNALFTVYDINTNSVSTTPAIVPNVAQGSYSKIADELFVLVTYDSKGNTLVNTCNIGTNLAPFIASSFKLGYFPVDYVDTIPNTYTIIVYSNAAYSEGISYVEIDYFFGQITNFFTGNPPLIFSNGSWVYYSSEGYFITNQNRTSIQFISLPVSDYINYPTDYSIVYGVFTPQDTLTTYNQSYLVIFNCTSNTVTKSALPDLPCPQCLSAQDDFVLLEVKFDTVCSPCISYSANSQLIVSVNQNVYVTSFYGTEGDVVFGDYKNQIVRVFIVEGHNSAIATYAYMNDSQVNTILTPDYAEAVYAVNSTLAFVNGALNVQGGMPIYYIYDVVTNETVYWIEPGNENYLVQGKAPGAALFNYNSSLNSLFNGWAIPLQLDDSALETVRIYQDDGEFVDLSFAEDVYIQGWTQTGFSILSGGNGIIGYNSLYEFSTDDIGIEY